MSGDDNRKGIFNDAPNRGVQHYHEGPKRFELTDDVLRQILETVRGHRVRVANCGSPRSEAAVKAIKDYLRANGVDVPEVIVIEYMKRMAQPISIVRGADHEGPNLTVNVDVDQTWD